MDEAVLRAMARWPEVPDLYDWLSLDRRGRWRLREETISHRGLIEFINRNYQSDGTGRWFFQNGPQRVFVSLQYTPWVYRLQPDGSVRTHTGVSQVTPEHALIDETGSVLLAGTAGVGVVDDRDLAGLADRLRGPGGRPAQESDLLVDTSGAAGDSDLTLTVAGVTLRVGRIQSQQLAGRFGFQPRPRAPADTR